MKIVWFKWIDSESHQEPWIDCKDIGELQEIEAIGFLVKESKVSLTITTCPNPHAKEVNSPITVPLVAITEGPYDIEFKR